MARIGFFTSHNLDQQGFGNLSEAAKARQAWPLRFTPAVCITVVAVGLALQSPVMVGAVALVGVTGVLFPNGMVVDLLYNAVVRHLVGAPRLPPTPRPRRFSYLISTVLLTGSAVALQLGWTGLGVVLGGTVVVAGAVLTTTLWCLGSWIFRTLGGSTA
jgi:hypothetical protein